MPDPVTLDGTQHDHPDRSTGATSTFPFPTAASSTSRTATPAARRARARRATRPSRPTYPSSSQCGNVLVRGTYSGQLTIAAENDIIIDEDIIADVDRPARAGREQLRPGQAPFRPRRPAANCGNGTNGSAARLTDLRIDAAILAIQHSFIVDHYNCGASTGELEVNGAISQKCRGPVGTTGGGTTTAIDKDYNYDDRLRYSGAAELPGPGRVRLAHPARDDRLPVEAAARSRLRTWEPIPGR